MADYGRLNPTSIDARTQTNTTTDEVVADSGALLGGNYEIWLVAGSAAAARWSVARRNAANGADVGDVAVMRTIAGASAEFRLRYRAEAGERLVIRTPDAITGVIDVALYVEALA